jgi:holin (3TMs family)
MAFPLIRLLPAILKAVARITGLSEVGTAADALQKAQLTPEQDAALQEELLRHEQAMKALSVDELKAAIAAATAESTAMIQSGDAYVSRARPTMLYAATAITVAISLAVGVVVIRGGTVDLAIAGVLSTLMLPLWGAAGLYVDRRTKEKMNGVEDK